MTGYDHDRRNRTWEEVHGRSEHGRAIARKATAQKKLNRQASRFGKVNWDAYQHDQLYDMIMKAKPENMYARAEQWQTLASKIEGTTGRVQQIMENVMGAWQGQAAVSSAESNSRLMQWAGDASTTAGTIAQSMATYTEAVERAQRHMPEPSFATAERNFRDGYTVTGTGGPSTAILLKQLVSDGIVSHQETKARKAEAVQVMETYEAQSKDVHDTMPGFTPVAPTTHDVEPWTPQADDDSGSSPASPGARPGSRGVGAGGGVGAAGNSGTSAAGFVAPSAGGPGGLPGGPGSGSGGLPGFGGGLGSLGSGGSEVIRNSPGFGVAGMGGVPGRGGFGGALAGGRGAGGPGMFGGAPGGHANGEEDKEHKNKYDEGMDFFDDLPPAYPSVFGA